MHLKDDQIKVLKTTSLAQLVYTKTSHSFIVAAYV